MNDTTALESMVKLRFSIDHPDVEECYVYGYECAASGLSEDDNPFAAHTREHEFWSEGWWAGFYGDEPIHALEQSDVERSEKSLLPAANDQVFHDGMGNFLLKVLEITSVIAVSALVGYQVLDLVA